MEERYVCVEVIGVGGARGSLCYSVAIIIGYHSLDHFRPLSCSPPLSMQIIAPLLRVLEKMHSQCMMHRDIKPENIFLSRSGRMRLGDFGLAMDWTKELPFSRSGTLDYMVRACGTAVIFSRASLPWELGECLDKRGTQ